MGEIERRIRRHFEREILEVRVPDPPARAAAPARGMLAAGSRRRIPPALVDALVRAAAVFLVIGSLVLLAHAFPQQTALGDTVAAIVRERSYERLFPCSELVWDMIGDTLQRRDVQ